jgi:chemotaxis protein histidine kinase CheA
VLTKPESSQMSKSQSKDIQSLLELTSKACSEIVDLVTDLPPQGSVAALEICLDHVEKIGMAADALGLTSLDTIAADVHTHFGADSGVLTPQLGVDLVSWFGDVISHIESPDNSGILESLLNPLPAELKPEIRTTLGIPGVEEIVDEPEVAIVDDEIALTEIIETDDSDSSMSAKEVVSAEFPVENANEDETVVSNCGGIDDNNLFKVDEDISDTEFSTGLTNEDETAIAWPSENDDDNFLLVGEEDVETTFPGDASGEDVASLSNSTEIDMSIFDDDGDTDLGDDSLLGMLASELKEVSPQLSELAQTLTSTEDAGELIEAIGAYQEVVYRVATVSEGLGLHGLVLVADFVAKNALQMAELALSDRASCVEVLQGWPDVIIDHLAQPKNDVLCHAVVDYLEKDNWPLPLPYRDVRDLIKGLTKELEMTGDYEVDSRDTEAKPEDVSLEMSRDASPMLIEAFFAESPGHAETFSSLVESIANGEDIQNNVEAAQRIAHTLKGSGNLVGTRGIASLSHHIEDIFEYIAKHKITPPAALAHTMQEAADTIEVMLEYLQGLAPQPEEAQRVLQDVLNWANRIDNGDLRQQDFDKQTMVSGSESEDNIQLEPEQQPGDYAECKRASDTPSRRASDVPRRESDAPNVPLLAQAEAVRVPAAVLDNIFRIVGENAIAIGRIQNHLKRLEDGNKQVRKNDVALQQRRFELENLVSIRGMAAQHRSIAVAGGDSSFDSLEMDEYDEFYGATHAYIEGVTDSREILNAINHEVSGLNDLFLRQQRLNKELQQVVMTSRMVPVSNLSARLQRAVRQVCRATDKQAELNIVGEGLLIDGDVLNKLADPLMHMIRNAVDHSIEKSEARLDKGKSEKGNISLSFQQEGRSVVVACTDDGCGLDYERIREIAVKRGLMTAQERADDHSLSRMILKSGFSTRDQVTQVSGRGVGMDVVNDTIQRLNGSMDIGDAETGGTRISLRLPITLLTSHCLLVGAGNNMVYAIPTTTLAQILSPGIGKIGDVGGKQSYQLNQDVFPSHSLNSLLGLPDDEDAGHDKTVLLLQTATGITAITVDRVINSFDLVVKNMGAYVKEVRGVVGVSTLGDGSVVALLDLATLLHSSESGGINITGNDTNNRAIPAADAVLQTKVLIVDDSLSVRNSLSQLMNDGGYHVVVARDGLEAIDMLDKEQPDIVLTDLEMPRMNGLELANYIRKSERWSSIPIVMITSRTLAKHREQAEAAGVNRYITKPFTEDEVLASIDEHLALA